MVPLKEGNFWVYKELHIPRKKYTIVSDSLIINDSLRYYIIIDSEYPSNPALMRLIKDESYVRRLGEDYPEPNHEAIYYKNNLKVGDSWSSYKGGVYPLIYYTVMDTLALNIWGKDVTVKFITITDSSGLWGFDQAWTDEFGLMGENEAGWILSTLLGCYLDGIVYGDTNMVVGVDDEIKPVNNFFLYQNYPNPFNPMTTIQYEIIKTDFIDLRVYNILGKEVALLVKEEKLPGLYSIEFNARGLPSGVYFYELRIGGQRQTRKMILFR